MLNPHKLKDKGTQSIYKQLAKRIKHDYRIKNWPDDFLDNYLLNHEGWSLSTLRSITKPIANKTKSDAIPIFWEEKIYEIVPNRTGPKKAVTFPENE